MRARKKEVLRCSLVALVKKSLRFLPFKGSTQHIFFGLPQIRGLSQTRQMIQSNPRKKSLSSLPDAGDDGKRQQCH